MPEEKKQPQGWKDVKIHAGMPLEIIVDFFNVLNQRLCTVEDIVTTMHNGKAISLTDLYAIQAEEATKALETAPAQPEQPKEGE